MKISKVKSEDVSLRRTDHARVKRQEDNNTNNGRSNIVHQAKYGTTQTQGMNSGDPEVSKSPEEKRQ